MKYFEGVQCFKMLSACKQHVLLSKQHNTVFCGVAPVRFSKLGMYYNYTAGNTVSSGLYEPRRPGAVRTLN